MTLQLYYGAPGRMADTLGQILLELAKAGVRVFVLYDAFGRHSCRTSRHAARRRDPRRAISPDPLIDAPSRAEPLACARHRDRQPDRVDGSVWHRRQVVWRRSHGSWRETNVRFEEPAVRQLQAAFAAAWVEATGVLFTGRAILAPPRKRSHSRRIVVRVTHGRQHAGRTLLCPLDRRRTQDALYHQCVLRAEPQLHRQFLIH